MNYAQRGEVIILLRLRYYGKSSCALADLLDLKISEIPLSVCRVTFSVVVNH